MLLRVSAMEPFEICESNLRVISRRRLSINVEQNTRVLEVVRAREAHTTRQRSGTTLRDPNLRARRIELRATERVALVRALALVQRNDLGTDDIITCLEV